MTQSNSDVLRGFFEEVANQKRLDLLPKYLSKDYIGHGSPYVGMGFAPDDSSGEKVTIRAVVPGGPSEGKLMAGDEIVRVVDGERTWETFEELRQATWGQGVVGTPLTMWVRREGEEHEIALVRGLVESFDFTYEFVEEVLPEYVKDWPETETRLVKAIEVGNLVAYHAENRGYHARFGRSAVWAEFGFVRVQEGKITDWWSAEDSFSQLKQLGYSIEEPRVVNE
jgi:hypothetical protein